MQSCPPQVGLDAMRQRIAHLTDEFVGGDSTNNGNADWVEHQLESEADPATTS